MKKSFFKKLSTSLLLAFTILSPTFSAWANINTDTTTRHAIYANPHNPSPNQSSVIEGIEMYTRYSAVNNLTGSIEHSAKGWNKVLQDIDPNIRTLVANWADVLDAKNYSNLTAEGYIENDSATDKKIALTFDFFTTRQAINPQLDEARIVSHLVSGNYDPTKITIRYNYIGGSYTSNDFSTPGFSLANVRSISINGTLAPGEKIQITAPIKTIQTDEKNVAITANFHHVSVDNVRTQDPGPAVLALKQHVYTISDKIFGKYAGAYRFTQNGRDVYKQVPGHIQAILPDVVASDLYYSMFKRIYTPGQQADLTPQVQDGIAYDQSLYVIKTERIFEAVKDHGYTTFADNTRGLWNAYAYTLNGSLRFTNDSGDQVPTGQVDSNGILLSPYYVELHKIFDTKDITLYVGDRWEQFDNLTFRNAIRPLGVNTDIPLRDDQITVTHNVDTSEPGIYNVKYAHEVAPNKWVTITAKVTVVGKYNVTHNFISKDGQELPAAVLDLLPAPQNNVETGTVVTAQSLSTESVLVEGGKWIFKGYGSYNSDTVNNQDITFTGTWEFVNTSVISDQPTKPDQPIKPNPPIKPELPKTGQSPSYVLTGYIIILLSTIFIFARKQN